MPHPDPDLIDALAYGMLEASEADFVETHASLCPNCAHRLRRVREEAGVLRQALAGGERRTIRLRPLPAVAAAAVLLAVFSFWLRPVDGPVELPDGSVVHADGEVVVEGDRVVRLLPGRYFLDIVPGPTPFRVLTPAAEIEVHGTSFFVTVKEAEMGRSTALATVVAVVTGAVAIGNYFGWIELGAGEGAVAKETSRPEARSSDDPVIEELKLILADKARRVADLERELAAPRETGRTALETAVAVHSVFKTDPCKGDEELLENLAAAGEDGFRAVVALLRGGANGIWFKSMVKATWAPGLESMLIELAEDPDVAPFSKWSALSALGVTDTGTARDYLVDRLRREQDPGLYMSAAAALGDLAEPRGALLVDERITEPKWSGVRRSILQSLGRMGGPDAASFLVDYVRSQGADQLSSAFRALHEVDEAAAEIEAASMLAGPRAKYLDRRTRDLLKKYAEGGR